MRKRNLVIIGTCLIILAVAVTAAAMLGRRDHITSEHWAQAKATSAAVRCRADNAGLKLAKSTRDTIEMNALGHLIDVPAGTNVDVRIASYSPTRVAGSDHYPAKYGDYNFVMTKQHDGWHFTEFRHCY